MNHHRPIGIEIAKQELVRINDKLILNSKQPLLLVGGLAVNRYIKKRKTKDIDLVCGYDESMELLDLLYPSDEWEMDDLNDDYYRPCYEIKHKYKQYGEVVLGFKIKEREPYDFIDWEALLKNGIPYKRKDKDLEYIVIPSCSDLAFTKLISFLDRDVSKLDKRQKDLCDFTDLSNHKEFSINDFLSLIKGSTSEDYISENFNLNEKEELIFCKSAIRKQFEIFGKQKSQSFFGRSSEELSDRGQEYSKIQNEINRPSRMRALVSDEHYIERYEAKKLLNRFAIALNQPEKEPLVFNICGIGGVGKTTLLGRLQKAHVDTVDFVEICFTNTPGVETPLKLMRKFIELLGGETNTNAFSQRNKEFETTLSEFSQKSVDGEMLSSEETRKVRNWFEKLVWLGSTGLTSTSNRSNSFEALGSEFSGSLVIGENTESLQDWIQQRVRKHPATRDKTELQGLMLEPVYKLTQAFVESLIQISRNTERPLVLILDTYEKAQPYLNQWLWKYLVADTRLYSTSVRLVVLGRRSLEEDEGWRKLDQDRKLLCEAKLTKFEKEDTKRYLKQIGIEKGRTLVDIHRVTKGLPYYLNWVRKQHKQGKELDFSRANQAIARLLLQGRKDYQQRKKFLQVMACCRWFDKKIIQYLLKNDDLGLQQNNNNAENCLEWLEKSDFVEFSKRRYRFDDVARDVFRQSYYEDDSEQFCRTNALLADYFKQKADELFDPQSPLPDPYEDQDWRKQITESIYYGLFGKKRKGLRQYIEKIFIAAYLEEPDVFMVPFALIKAEINQENKYLLPSKTDQFFKDVAMVLSFGWYFLGKVPRSYKIKVKGENNPLKTAEVFSKSMEKSIQFLLQEVDYLENDVSKTIGIMYKSLRCDKRKERVNLLQKAKNQTEEILIYCRPKLVHRIFSKLSILLISNKLYEESLYCCRKVIDLGQDDSLTFFIQGSALGNLQRHEKALESFNKAIEIDSNSVQAWISQGKAFNNLERYSEALESYKKAIELDSNSVQAWISQGKAFGNLERYSEALESFKKAIELDSNSVEAWIVQAGTFSRWKTFLKRR